MNRYAWVGLFFIVGLILLIVLSMKVDDEGHIFKGGYNKTYFTVMKSIGTVGRGSLVRAESCCPPLAASSIATGCAARRPTSRRRPGESSRHRAP